MDHRWRTSILGWLLGLLAIPLLMGQQPPGERPPLRTLDSHFPFQVPGELAAWTARAEQLRLHVQVSLGLWPLPSRTPLQAVIHGAVDAGDYTVERVYFQSMPGFFVTGSLYRPKRQAGDQVARRPGILCPHGHYTQGRFTEFNAEAVAQMLARGEESLAENARSPLQARCAHLARLGCVVFHYDMIGYADSQQISHAIAHGFAKPRAGQNAADGWGFFSPRAEMHLQSIMGLQTWNSIRAIDFLESLPDVDPQRIAVTGSSGGGTQTFLLCAIDPRPAAAFPAVMVSTGMQGGCTCENCCNLRVATGNVELAALYAPKPLGLSAADDWTKTMPSDGYPQLQAHYALLGRPENVFLAPSLAFPHSYNQVARRVMYAWFARHLQIPVKQTESLESVLEGKLAEDSPFRERPIQFLSPEQLTVWNSEHPAPVADVALESKLTRFWSAEQHRQFRERLKQVDPQLKQVARSLLVDLAEPQGQAPPRLKLPSRVMFDEYTLVSGAFGDGWDAPDLEIMVINRQDADPAVPAEKDGRPAGQAPPPQRVLIWVVAGKTIPADLRLFTAAGFQVVLVQCPKVLEPNPLVANGREGAAAYTFGYNRGSLASTARLLRFYLDWFPRVDGQQVSLVALDGAAPAAILAAAAAESPLDRVIFRDQYRLANVDDFTNPHFLPGALVLGDIPGLLQIARPGEIVCLGDFAEDLTSIVGGTDQKSAVRLRTVQDLEELSRQ